MKSNSKYALVVISSYTYMHGLTLLLNALDYYNHTDLDVYVLYGERMQPYIDYLQNRFSFNLSCVPVREYGDQTFDENCNCIYSKYNFILQNCSSYDAIAIFDADCFLSDNLLNYFKITASTDLLLCPRHSGYHSWKEDYATNVRKNVEGDALRNYPWFFNPRYHLDVVQYLWDKRESYNPSLDTTRFTDALFELNKTSCLFELPGTLWMGETLLHATRLRLESHGSKLFLVTCLGEKISVSHMRHWRTDWMRTHLQGLENDTTSNRTNALYNFSIFTQIMNVLGTWKTNFQDILNLDPFYKETIFV